MGKSHIQEREREEFYTYFKAYVLTQKGYLSIHQVPLERGIGFLHT
jgi:hypothetical protein